eukprot:TRINITY_DN2811_c0_g1_i2.p1 TRINITY_DN2811_c0_g1~~TRINITY_DN2811_c0_g1_i2.p1  ORF type:complete len:244 (+),score=59.91 TRINITY_DN2811_c0_g1_i2:652-1383(+)
MERLHAYERREKELLERERKLAKLEASLMNQKRPPNWPPKPCPCHCVHQNIKGEIAYGWLVVYQAYIHWMYTCIAVVFNFVCVVALVLAEKAIADLVIAIVIFFICPAAFFGIFRLLYNAARRQLAVGYLTFLMALLGEIVIHIAVIVGWNGTGMAGTKWAVVLFTPVEGQKKHMTVAFMCVANVALWSSSCAFCLYLLVRGCLLFRRRHRAAEQQRSLEEANLDAALPPSPSTGGFDFERPH